MPITTPSYIKNPDIENEPLDCAWKGALAHIGPVETVNKMFNLVASKTTCGMLAQTAGIIGWGAWRLKQQTEVTPLFQMIEASFAFQVHPSYVDRDGVPTWAADDEPAAESAAGQLQVFLWQALNTRKWWNSYYQPIDSAFHSAYLVRHIMPKKEKKAFSQWLEAMLSRMAVVAPKPDEQPVDDEEALTPEERAAYYSRHWGEPLPPEVLNLEVEYDASKREEFVDRFLRALDHKASPFLRSPDEIKSLGFEGTPYQLS